MPDFVALPDTTFHASRFELDGEYGETFTAPDWQTAERICAERGWVLRGRGGYRTTSADFTENDANALIEALNEKAEKGADDA